jgi:NADH:ubiquinone oxidoreductase subunit 2 (subunit N)
VGRRRLSRRADAGYGLSVGRQQGAGLAFFFQLFFRIFGGVLPDLAWVIAMLAALTMTVGNTVAIVQHNIKRFMAFSAFRKPVIF